MDAMWYYYIGVIVLIVLWFLAIVIFSEQIRKSVFAEFFTCRLISLWNESMFLTSKYYQLENFSELKAETSDGQLKVLEVGVGEGTNFELYPPNCKLTAFEYNEYFKKKFTENVKKFSKIKLEKFVNGFVEDMHVLKDNTFDVVLCTHVLCSVSDVPAGLKEIKRVLKEGGKFFFIEHVAYEPICLGNEFWTVVQGLLEPIWKIIMGGCCLRKTTFVDLEKAGFSTVTVTREYSPRLPAILRPHIWGCAVK
ncbi:hypothetical protein HA402_007280 [Bradysia odoriphaga]|nr:hypothetical protein HA402_007280 [Bradysia odoriphaga]